MVRVQKVHHQRPRGCLSPLDPHRLRIKSPKSRNSAARRSEHSKARNATRNGEGYGNSPFTHHSKHDISYFGLNDMTLHDEESNVSEDELFQWEEEETLVNALINDGAPVHLENQSIMTLVDSLQTSFATQGTKVLHGLAQNLVPAAKRVKEVHRALEQGIDPMYAQGLLTFDNACQSAEATSTQQEGQLLRSYTEAQTNLQRLFDELDVLYVQRKELWKTLEDNMERIDTPIRNDLKDLPARLERTVTELEKRSKSLTKDDTKTSKDEAAYLKSLISKFA
ncbi:hypothetical protein EYR40_000909 [Pleurotus pulmonarius]|nr:hypothetical protein EYR36_004640 [Pleurotus pulmonarius]KAF4578932.1 hypothetical protein EYR36_000741 [Pleurotus pulmonarius]KAF4603739.1 hypothetical protein EYR38_004154 [Pleurotus pulmonarius]KAF4608564.1 hypothetical protein EYR40_000909 [Pleurotus pulmonarius]